VLLDNDFALFPSVVNEGRRVIANVERVANLFLTKTFYAVALAVIIGIGRMPFPFLPRHFTLLSSLTIGIPGFFLALSKNNRRAVTGFLRRVLRFAIPAGGLAAIATSVSYVVARADIGTGDAELAETRTVAVITLFTIAIWVLTILCRPFVAWKVLLVGSMVALFVGALLVPFPRDYFDLVLPRANDVAAAVGFGAVAAVILEVMWRLSDWTIPGTIDSDD